MRSAAGALLAVYCAALGAFEQPIGNSAQGFVSRLTIEVCANRHDDARTLKVTEQVVIGETGKTVGKPRHTYIDIPKPDPSQAEPPLDGAN